MLGDPEGFLGWATMPRSGGAPTVPLGRAALGTVKGLFPKLRCICKALDLIFEINGATMGRSYSSKGGVSLMITEATRVSANVLGVLTQRWPHPSKGSREKIAWGT